MKKALGLLMAVVLAAGALGCSVSVSVSDKTDKTAEELMEIVLNSVQFPQLVELTDEERIKGDLGIDLSLVKEYAVVQQMLSVDICEVIILIAKDEGAAKELEGVLEARKESLINDFAFYPNQVAWAEATEVGKVMNVVYLICHEEADEAAQALIEEVTDA
ncbi:MAG: DUF4358 domain-containing protein [Oscillospiraceae bacterium]|nr:DUF4358 domain-containing protein [Oscillospiraceae bacterium]